MGLVIRVSAVLTLFLMSAGGASAQWPQGKPMKMPAAGSGPNLTATGRYQIFISPNMKGRTFMLDSDTGRIWVFEKDHTSGEYEVKRVTVEGLQESGKGKGSSEGTVKKESKGQSESGKAKDSPATDSK